jgi:allantoin racemase
MRIRYVIPGPMGRTPDGREEVERRGALLRRWAAPDVDASIADTPTGPASIESAYEEYLSVPAAVEALEEAERDGVDAVIVGCFDDPGVDALRELATRTLVVGPGATSMHATALLGSSFGLVTVPNPTAVKKLVVTERLDVRLAGIALVDIPVLGLRDDVEATRRGIVEAAGSLLERGADTIVLGCMSMAFLDLDDELSAALGVPVVNPAKVALGFAEALVRARLLPSRRAYPLPPKLADGAALSDLRVGVE